MLHVGGVRTALFSWLYARACRRQVHPARRGHRPRAVHRRGGARHPRGHGVARAQGRRGSVLPDAALRPVPGGASRRCCSTARPITATAPSRSSMRCASSRSRARRSRATPGICRERTEPRPGVDPVVRFRNPADGAVVVRGPGARGGHVPEHRARRSDHRALGRHAHLQLLRGGRRHGHGRHPRDSRRRPSEQHAAADEHAAGARARRRRRMRTCR